MFHNCLWESLRSLVRSPAHLIPIKSDSISFILLHDSEWDDDQLFEMKHKRNPPCSKSFNNRALKMGLPDSASDEKANWNEFLIHPSKKLWQGGRVTNVHMYTREPGKKVYFLSSNLKTDFIMMRKMIESEWYLQCNVFQQTLLYDAFPSNISWTRQQ